MKYIIYEVVEKGDGTFYPRIRNINNGCKFGAWNGYCKTFIEALRQLELRKQEDEESRIRNSEKVVYTLK